MCVCVCVCVCLYFLISYICQIFQVFKYMHGPYYSNEFLWKGGFR